MGACALRGRGLIRADAALQAEAAVGAVTGIAYDSRAVARGNVFVALKGQHADGTTFARHALERGAAAVVSEQEPPDGVHVPLRLTHQSLGQPLVTLPVRALNAVAG